MSSEQPSGWVKELQGLAQSFTRALIFGIAFIYTMETWWIGAYLTYERLILFFLLAFAINMYLIPITSNSQTKFTFLRIFRIAARNKGLSVLATFIILWVMGRVQPFRQPLEEDLALVMLLSIPVSIGADVAQILTIFPTSKSDQKSGQSDRKNPWKFILKDIGSVTGGVLFVSLPIAPTQEVQMLATRVDYGQEMAIMVLSFLLSLMIVYGSGITRQPPSGKNTKGAFIWPYANSLMSYGVALLMSGLVLYFLGRIHAGMTLEDSLAQIIVLGLPSVIGGAAGKLAF